jgi:Zn-dependent peptidase ImmA (M78 family)/DNA-binding XRE family transcriptional regulator
MNQLFAERFKSARLINGYSLQDLSDILGNKVTRQALHKYEKGEVMPDSEMIDLLCEALHVRPDFFSRETLIELEEVNFRKLVKYSEKDQASVIEKTKEILSRYLEIEELLKLENTFDHPLKDIKNINSIEDIENAAIEVRNYWKLGDEPIANVVELLEDVNIKIIEIDAGKDFDGLQTWIRSRNIPVIVINSRIDKSRDRKRFTILHELGHLLMHDKGIPEKMSEKYCHAFAGAMLLPASSLKRVLGEKRNKLAIQELGMLKQQYGISIQAIIMRALNLGIISDYYTKYYFKYINEMGWKVEEPYKFEGKESPRKFDQLIFRGISEEIISMSKAAALKNMKLAEFRSKFLVVQ